MRNSVLAFAFVLCACGTNSGVQSSLRAISYSGESESPVFLDESRYAEQMTSLVNPLIEQAETGFFDGKDGASLFYAKIEHPHPKAKIAVVPGYTENFVKWHETIYNFYQSGYSVYFYEHRGMGQSDRLVASDKEIVWVKQFADYTDDLKTFLTTVVPDDSLPLLVFAHSMGAGITSDLLTREPNLVKAAVMNSPMLGINTGKYPKPVALSIAAGAVLIGKGQTYAPGETGVDFDQWVVETANTSSAERFYRYKEAVQELGTANGGSSFGWVKEVLLTSYRLGHSWVAARVTTPILMSSAGLEQMVVNADQEKFCAAAKNCKLVKQPTSRHETYNEIGPIRTPWITQAIRFFDGFQK